MQYPKNELIAEHIRETVAGVQLIAGASKTLIPRRFSHLPIVPEDGLAIIVQADPIRETDAPLNYIQWMQPFAIHVFVFEHETSDIGIETRCNCVRADLEKALMTDATRDGYAIDTMIESPTYWGTVDGNYSGVTVNCTVRYRTSETDPYQ